MTMIDSVTEACRDRHLIRRVFYAVSGLFRKIGNAIMTACSNVVSLDNIFKGKFTFLSLSHTHADRQTNITKQQIQTDIHTHTHTCATHTHLRHTHIHTHTHTRARAHTHLRDTHTDRHNITKRIYLHTRARAHPYKQNNLVLRDVSRIRNQFKGDADPLRPRMYRMAEGIQVQLTPVLSDPRVMDLPKPQSRNFCIEMT